MHCAACVWLIEKLPRVVRAAAGDAAGQGVVEARLSMRQATVRIVWDPTRVKLSTIAHALNTLGYRRTRQGTVQAGAAPTRRAQAADEHWARRGAGGEHHAARRGAVRRAVGRDGAAVRAAVPLPGRRAGRVGALGAGACVLLRRVDRAARPQPATWTADRVGARRRGGGGRGERCARRGDIYFDSLAVLVFLLLVGRYIQFRQQRMPTTPSRSWPR